MSNDLTFSPVTKYIDDYDYLEIIMCRMSVSLRLYLSSLKNVYTQRAEIKLVQ